MLKLLDESLDEYIRPFVLLNVRALTVYFDDCLLHIIDILSCFGYVPYLLIGEQAFNYFASSQESFRVGRADLMCGLDDIAWLDICLSETV
jgi:hypothetical protein